MKFWHLYMKKKLIKNIIKNKQTKIKKNNLLNQETRCILCILGKASKKIESSEINAKIE